MCCSGSRFLLIPSSFILFLLFFFLGIKTKKIWNQIKFFGSNLFLLELEPQCKQFTCWKTRSNVSFYSRETECKQFGLTSGSKCLHNLEVFNKIHNCPLVSTICCHTSRIPFESVGRKLLQNSVKKKIKCCQGNPSNARVHFPYFDHSVLLNKKIHMIVCMWSSVLCVDDPSSKTCVMLVTIIGFEKRLKPATPRLWLQGVLWGLVLPFVASIFPLFFLIFFPLIVSNPHVLLEWFWPDAK